jgi:hypothetical protein
VHHATETIATQDTNVTSLLHRRYRWPCRTGRREGERSMRSVAVVVLHAADDAAIATVRSHQAVSRIGFADGKILRRRRRLASPQLN